MVETMIVREPADPLGRLMEMAGASPASRVLVVGHRTLEVMVGLCRKGFAQAACHGPGRGPHSTEDHADILVIPDAATEGEVAHIITLFDSVLHRNGMVALSHRGGPAAAASLCRLLAARGYEPVPGTGRFAGLLCARKMRVFTAALAA
jgi:hypothetical protein